ncbi:HAMP domain-containing histidine kinase [Sporolactobacillus shoreicorticis]|uniref:histidine kinase n=1 Tax=Sporolactobacillus shoreicorticis TaxID=1923877 RepID=A0ABW5RXB9_9BACL|nr:HAMP domain-containing sensor histidine kinase [Sporolactobacillus shoreicorticis]MCO7124947.1 HAMP domain-containing histidine kinase [Sporolactobacillus shoreicorticis]
MRLPFKMTLTKRIWLSFAFLELVIGMIILVVYPYSIQSTLRENTFRSIEVQQLVNYQKIRDDGYGVDNPGVDGQNYSAGYVWTFVVNKNFQILAAGFPTDVHVLKELKGRIRHQKSELARYELKQNDSTIYFVVRRIADSYLISFMFDTYNNELRNNLWSRLIFTFAMASIFSLFLAFWLARYIKRPLDILGRRFKEISRLNWEKPFEWKGDLEYERLSAQFEEMRLNLIKYDQSQKVFLQQASHELKTPIMVVQSYAQSVKDGIYPNGGLNDSMNIIIQESQQMEKRVRKLLYFTRFDSLGDKQMRYSLIRFGDLADFVRERFMTQRADIDIHVGGEDTLIYADQEQMQTVLENLVENALRYAKKNIWIDADGSSRYRSLISVKNDGPAIPEHERQVMFQPFQKGEKGQFGLGMAIVKRIIHNHHGVIHVANTEDGVLFEMTLPAPPKGKSGNKSDTLNEKN